jgi:hypothetical protein
MPPSRQRFPDDRDFESRNCVNPRVAAWMGVEFEIRGRPSNATLVAQRIHSIIVDELLVSRSRLEMQTFDHGLEHWRFVVVVRQCERPVGRHPLRICDGIDGKDIAGGCGIEKEQNLGDQLRTDQLPFCSHHSSWYGIT